jgi:methyl-accepting chemotaxis protein
MKITSKIIAGYGILIVLMAGLLAYELFALHRMQSISRDLSSVNFRASIASLQLMRERDLVEEYVRKYFLVGDPQYKRALVEFQEQFEATLEVVVVNARSVKEKEGAGRLSEDWKAFTSELTTEQSLLKTESFAAFPENLNARLERLRGQILDVYQSTLAAIESEVQRSSATGRAAESVTWIVAGFALIIGCAVTFFITRSISKPLRSLTEGTNRISAGQFDYRLDVSRNDEFAQLARDFNTMTRRLNELDQMKKDFVSHVSHELKAPLSSMREALQLLLDELPGPLTAKQKRLLEINLQCGRRLSSATCSTCRAWKPA